MKFTFTKGEEENTFVAAGTHYRNGNYRTYKITGKWSTSSEAGERIPVELEIVYVDKQRNLQLDGTFDPEEKSLRGSIFKSPIAGFVFKRDPDFVRFYPAPALVNARSRWAFAITSVLDRIRQEAWSSARILKRIKDGKRFVDFVIRHNYYGRSLSSPGLVDLGALFTVLYEADVRFYASLINVKLSATTIL